jgi:hypothetical protein
MARLPGSIPDLVAQFGPHLNREPSGGWTTRGEPDPIVPTHCCFCGQQCGMGQQVGAKLLDRQGAAIVAAPPHRQRYARHHQHGRDVEDVEDERRKWAREIECEGVPAKHERLVTLLRGTCRFEMNPAERQRERHRGGEDAAPEDAPVRRPLVMLFAVSITGIFLTVSTHLMRGLHFVFLSQLHAVTRDLHASLSALWQVLPNLPAARAARRGVLSRDRGQG